MVWRMRLKGADADPAPPARQWNSLKRIPRASRDANAPQLEKKNWSEAGEALWARFVAHSDTREHENYVRCRSAARVEKEKNHARKTEKTRL